MNGMGAAGRFSFWPGIGLSCGFSWSGRLEVSVPSIDRLDYSIFVLGVRGQWKIGDPLHIESGISEDLSRAVGRQSFAEQ